MGAIVHNLLDDFCRCLHGVDQRDTSGGKQNNASLHSTNAGGGTYYDFGNYTSVECAFW
jgi:hypothetical protein